MALGNRKGFFCVFFLFLKTRVIQVFGEAAGLPHTTSHELPSFSTS